MMTEDHLLYMCVLAFFFLIFFKFIYSRYIEFDWQQKLKYIGDIYNTITDRNLYKQEN